MTYTYPSLILVLPLKKRHDSYERETELALDINVSPSRAANVVDDDLMSNVSDMLADNPAELRETPDRNGNLF
jgi:hypothetical protein